MLYKHRFVISETTMVLAQTIRRFRGRDTQRYAILWFDYASDTLLKSGPKAFGTALERNTVITRRGHWTIARAPLKDDHRGGSRDDDSAPSTRCLPNLDWAQRRTGRVAGMHRSRRARAGGHCVTLWGSWHWQIAAHGRTATGCRSSRVPPPRWPVLPNRSFLPLCPPA